MVGFKKPPEKREKHARNLKTSNNKVNQNRFSHVLAIFVHDYAHLFQRFAINKQQQNDWADSPSQP
jgi:hypothetical protein